MYLFDTNIFLEVLLGQKNAISCKRSLELIDGQHQGWVTSFSLHAIEAILGGKVGRQDVLQRFLQDLDRDDLLSRYETTTQEELDITHLASKLLLDFDDTLQYYVAQKKKLTLVTLDHDFKKVADIKVTTPMALVASNFTYPV